MLSRRLLGKWFDTERSFKHLSVQDFTLIHLSKFPAELDWNKGKSNHRVRYLTLKCFSVQLFRKWVAELFAVRGHWPAAALSILFPLWWALTCPGLWMALWPECNGDETKLYFEAFKSAAGIYNYGNRHCF